MSLCDAWYFRESRQPQMPFSVLLEIGLQPCGWLAAYLGSALTSPIDLSFRNLDGKAMQHRAVTPAERDADDAGEDYPHLQQRRHDHPGLRLRRQR